MAGNIRDRADGTRRNSPCPSAVAPSGSGRQASSIMNVPHRQLPAAGSVPPPDAPVRHRVHRLACRHHEVRRSWLTPHRRRHHFVVDIVTEKWAKGQIGGRNRLEASVVMGRISPHGDIPSSRGHRPNCVAMSSSRRNMEVVPSRSPFGIRLGPKSAVNRSRIGREVTAGHRFVHQPNIVRTWRTCRPLRLRTRLPNHRVW